MSPSEVWIPVLFYVLPMLFFFYMGIDVLLRNPKKIEHILVSLTILCYFLLFLEEYVRFLLPIEYSPALTAFWFANVGIAIPGLGAHLLAKLIGLDKRLPRPWYPFLFHILLLAIPAGLISSGQLISAQQFVEVGPWKWPVANASYYGALTGSLLISLASIILLRMTRKKNSRTAFREHNGIFKLLEYGSLLTFSWVVVFGYFQLGKATPPYAYLYAGLIWCFILQLAMRKYEFLNFTGHRYEKLFQLNPQPILLADLSGNIREANPSAKMMFSQAPRLESAALDVIGGGLIIDMLRQRAKIGEFETELLNGSQKIEALITGDYVTVNNEPHALLLIRNITAHKDNLRQVAFMAHHDPLTELPNRRKFIEHLEQSIAESRRDGSELHVFVIDLDGFKQINDQYGHEAGDLVLCHVAAILREIALPSGLAARFGGDEFLLLIRGKLAADQAASQLSTAMEREVLRYGGERLDIQLSIGKSCYPRDGATPADLIRQADRTMYSSKQQRKSLR